MKPDLTLHILGKDWNFAKQDKKTIAAWPIGYREPWITCTIHVSEWDSMMTLMREIREVMEIPKNREMLGV